MLKKKKSKKYEQYYSCDYCKYILTEKQYIDFPECPNCWGHYFTVGSKKSIREMDYKINWKLLWKHLEKWREQEALKRSYPVSFIKVRQKIQELVEGQLKEKEE